VRIWVEDLKYHLVMALRAVGLALIAVAWASALASEAQQFTDTRAYIQVAAAVVCLVIIQALTRLPPSWTISGVLELLARDIVAIAREQSTSETLLRAAVAARIRRGANIPRDRRAWLRGLSRLAQADQARD
jgi:hypothetical protein